MLMSCFQFISNINKDIEILKTPFYMAVRVLLQQPAKLKQKKADSKQQLSLA